MVELPIEKRKEYYWTQVAASILTRDLNTLRKSFFALKALEDKTTIKA